ncbi:solute carrier organic anion transporter family member 4C1-like [Watersipora subatra]|uniref:solute carrier organic anion transporter family member 4C1-like n=1 Tax=Watersipora subatra TaxID=2589382 RepID=UPI00355BD621
MELTVASTIRSKEVTELVNTSCGYTTKCRPKWLQRFANAKASLVVITLFALIQGFAANGINGSNAVMYERRYQLTSRESSLIFVTFDITVGVVVIFIGYYGSIGHQPRILAVSSLVMCLGLFMMCLAQFTSPMYQPTGATSHANVSSLCHLENPLSSDCSSGDGSNSYLRRYISLLIIGQILNGCTGAALYTLSLTFIELTSTAAQSALYLGIFSSGSVLGPAIGFLSSGAFLDIYVDFPSSPPNGLSPDDPAWVGAWWLGFIIAMVLLVIVGLLLFLFPPEFSDTAEIKKAKISEAHDHGVYEHIKNSGFGQTWSRLPKTTLYLLKNPCYVLISIANSTDLAIVLGFATFFPKLFVVLFNLTPSYSAILTGAVAVPAAVIGQCASGAIIKNWDFSLKSILKYSLIVSAVSTCMVPVYLARCPDVEFAGINTHYNNKNELITPELTASCNDACECTTTLYDPVCADDVQYFSPCHAGCSQESYENRDGVKVFHNCTCPLIRDAGSGEVKSGRCDVKCKLLYSVLIPFGFLQFVTAFSLSTSMTVASLRVVSAELRTYSMAVQMVFLRFLGSVPGPLLFGAMFDASCLVWKGGCGSNGLCWVYDTKELTLRVTLLTLSLKFISLVCTAIALRLYKPTISQDEASMNSDETSSSSKSIK